VIVCAATEQDEHQGGVVVVRIRASVFVLIVSMAMAGCGSSSGGSSGSGETTPPAATGNGGGATSTPAGGGSTEGTGGTGGANGSVTYDITGDYTSSGELPFSPLLSTFGNGGWVAIFGENSGDTVFQINSIPGTEIVNFGNADIAIPGTRDGGCTIEFTQNDADGLVGTYECHGVVTAMSQTGSPATVDFSGDFDAHP
jgi:hypothetical protein